MCLRVERELTLRFEDETFSTSMLPGPKTFTLWKQKTKYFTSSTLLETLVFCFKDSRTLNN